MEPEENKILVAVSKFFLSGALIVFICFTAILMVAIAAMGVAEISIGVKAFWWDNPSSLNSGAVVEHVLKGLEFFFLSPLAFMVVWSVGRYLSANIKNLAESEKLLRRNELYFVKALVISLIIAIIATDLVSKILSVHGLTRDAALFESLVIIVLGAYLFVLERHSTGHAGTGEHEKERSMPED